jgi:hypothetical protein
MFSVSEKNGAAGHVNYLAAQNYQPAKWQEHEKGKNMNEIQKVPNASIQTFADVERAAQAMAASGFFRDTAQAAQAVVKILAGQELGFGAFASMTGVHIIQGKPVLAANLMAAAVKRGGKYNYRIIHHDEKSCSIDFYENGEKVGNSTFSMDDAKKAGISNQNWQKYPRNMLFARALSNGQKWFAPDIFNGATVYTPDEMGAVVDEDGAVIEVKAQDAQPSKRDKIIKRLAELRAEAKEHGVDVSAYEITDNMADDEIVKLGKELRELVVNAEAANEAAHQEQNVGE